MGHLKVVLGFIALATGISAWQHHRVDYRKNPPTVEIVGDARDTLNAAYAEYVHPDSAAPFIEQGFCARSWTTYRPTWNTTVVRITSIVRSETNASPIGVSIYCKQASSNNGGIVFHTHPPQQCVIKGNWTSWSDCAPTTDSTGLCRASYRDLSDTLAHRNIAARFVVCGQDKFVLYHATDAL